MKDESISARCAPRLLSFGEWEGADQVLSFAMAAEDSASSSLKESLRVSNLTFGPLADPLAIDFGVPRWLFAKREETHSD